MRTSVGPGAMFVLGAALLAGCASEGGRPEPRIGTPAPESPAESSAQISTDLPSPGSASPPSPPLVPVMLGQTASPTAEPEGVATQPVIPDLENTVIPLMLGQTASPSSITARLNRIVEEGELNPCRVIARPNQPLIDATQRRLFEMLCSASLWFDGLFGERRNLAAAQGASGRLELSIFHSEYEGTSYKGRGNVRVDFPNLDERIHAFLGRDDEEDFIQDRTEGLALRSQFLNVETNEGWLAGLGYGLPGSFRQRNDVRVGARLGSKTKIFVQGRHRRNWILDRRNIWRFRETIFWTNRDGFGSTTSLDYDHIFRRAMLLRWANVGTITEETRGFEWRTATLLYQDIPGPRAIAYEVFLRGWTDAEVPIREYGARAIFRHSLFRRNWLVGEAVLGYSWPREEIYEEREGSLNIGIGVELYFGRDLLPP